MRRAGRGLGLALLLACCTRANAQSPWQSLVNQPSFNADTALLLTDGTVLCSNYFTNQWFKLTPDAYGSYVNGTWSQVASAHYDRLFFDSAVLKDGRLFVAGGEYSNTGGNETNKVEIYDPVTNVWTKHASPPGWTEIGDSSCVELPTGNVFLGNLNNGTTMEFDPVKNKWTAHAVKDDWNAETEFTLLPNGNMITVNCVTSPRTELYIPSLDQWIDDGPVPNVLAAIADPSYVAELGPQLLLPYGNVLAVGANGHTDYYTPSGSVSTAGSWAAGPTMPADAGGNQLGTEDGPGCVLPSGNVLLCTSPAPVNGHGDFESGEVIYFEFNPTTNTYSQIEDPGTAAAADAAYGNRMLLLPTGQVLVTDGEVGSQVVVYTGAGSPNPAWAPVVSKGPSFIASGGTYALSGHQFNGLTAGAYYGDDVQTATNYPLVRVTNGSTGHVFYCRTHDHSTMAVATGSQTVSTNFDVPSGIETGPSTLEVVANGTSSAPVNITVLGGRDVTASISITRSSISYNKKSKLYTGTIKLLNKSKTTVSGPLNVLFEGLPSGVTLTNASGSKNGTPYITANISSLAYKASVTLPVQFTAPSASAITYTSAVISGTP